MRRTSFGVGGMDDDGPQLFPIVASTPDSAISCACGHLTMWGQMEIVAITVENFRSITSAKRIPLSDYTVLIGPNNEGKSNILKAVSIAMHTLEQWRPRRISLGEGRIAFAQPDKRYRSYNAGYAWSRDFPINLQSKKSCNKTSDVTIEFKLSDSEVDDFVREIGSNLNGTLPIKISYGRDEFDIAISKPGRGYKTLNKKTTRIANFVSQRLNFDYIPAVRTAGKAEDVVKKLVWEELRQIEEDEKYVSAMKVIEELSQPVLMRLSLAITNTVSSFLPSVKRVSLKIPSSNNSDMLRRVIKIEVDDGVMTDIDQKGDGVQSLVALGLMRHVSETQNRRYNNIVAIEEPESHLHPRAIRDLRDVVIKLSEKGQVLVSSHSPLMIKWGGASSTIIVADNKAVPARSISEVRECVGVMLSDNLQSVEFALFVEGEADRRIIGRLIECRATKKLKSLFHYSRFKLIPLGGVGKLSYRLSSAENNIIGFHVFLDNDAASLKELEKARDNKYINENEYNICRCIGMKESEIEDAISPKIYEQPLRDEFGVDVNKSFFGGNQKWSVRMKNGFQASGKLWDDAVETRVKTIVADAFCLNPIEDALIIQKSSALDALMTSLEDVAEKADE